MTLLRKVTGSESEHFAQLLLALAFIEIKSLQRALQTHCAFHNQARETINICALAARFPKFLQNLSFFLLSFAISIGGPWSHLFLFLVRNRFSLFLIKSIRFIFSPKTYFVRRKFSNSLEKASSTWFGNLRGFSFVGLFLLLLSYLSRKVHGKDQLPCINLLKIHFFTATTRFFFGN